MSRLSPAWPSAPKSFGRRSTLSAKVPDKPLREDARLFAMTFAAGFLFVTIFLA
jgi:hypothetical protein